MQDVRIAEEGSPYNRPLSLRVLYLFQIFFIICLCLSFLPLALENRGVHSGVSDIFPWLFTLLSLCAVPVVLIDFFVQKLWVFCLCILPFGALVLLPGAPFVRFLYGVVAGISILTLISRRFSTTRKEEKQKASAFIAVMILLAVLYFVSAALGFRSYRKLLLVGAVLFIFLFFWLMHESTVDYRLYLLNAETFDQPVYSLRRANQRSYGVFFIALAIALALVMIIPMDDLSGLASVGSLLITALGKIWNFLVSWLHLESGEEITKEPGVEEESQQDAEIIEEAGWFWVAMEYVLYAVLAIAVVAGIIYGLYKLYKLFYRRGRVAAEKLKEEESVEEVTEKISSGPRRLFTIWHEPKDPIRRKYYRLLARKIDKEVSRSATPRETGDIVNNSSLEALLPAYEEVRYSNCLNKKEKES